MDAKGGKSLALMRSLKGNLQEDAHAKQDNNQQQQQQQQQPQPQQQQQRQQRQQVPNVHQHQPQQLSVLGQPPNVNAGYMPGPGMNTGMPIGGMNMNSMNMAPNPIHIPQQQQMQQHRQPSVSTPTGGVRSKGKDFAQMSKSADKTMAPVMQQQQEHQPMMPQHQQYHPHQQATNMNHLQPVPIHGSTHDMSPSAPVPTPTPIQVMPNKSKGKDFVSMQKRASPSSLSQSQSQPQTISPVPPAPTLDDLTKQSQRSAADLKKQNAARIAAGMLPLETPTQQLPNSINVNVNGPQMMMPVPVSVPDPVAVHTNNPLQQQQQQQQSEKQNALLHQKRMMEANGQPARPGPGPGPAHAAKLNTNIPTMQPSMNPNANAEADTNRSGIILNSQTQNEKQIQKPPPSPKPTPRPTRAEGIISGASFMRSNNTQSQSQSKPQPPLLGRKLSSLVKSLDPSGLYSLEPDAEEQLLALANDFANSLIKKSVRVAQHRDSCASGGRTGNVSSSNGNGNGVQGPKRKRVEVEDVAIVLKKNYGIVIPGLSGKTSSTSRANMNNNATMAATGTNVALNTTRAMGSSSLPSDANANNLIGGAGDISSMGSSKGVTS